MRLIDADALMDVIRQHEYRLATKQGSIDYGMFTLGIQQAVDEQQTIDAVPVVRCRECKFGSWDSEPDDAMVCVRTNDGFGDLETTSAVVENGKKVLTMTEYIEREDLLELYRMDDPVLNENGHVPLSVIRQNIIDIPAADVAPVRHGRWIEQEKYTFGVMYDCSICGNRILDNGHSWNYCPNCGAKMDGGTENATN